MNNLNSVTSNGDPVLLAKLAHAGFAKVSEIDEKIAKAIELKEFWASQAEMSVISGLEVGALEGVQEKSKEIQYLEALKKSLNEV